MSTAFTRDVTNPPPPLPKLDVYKAEIYTWCYTYIAYIFIHSDGGIILWDTKVSKPFQTKTKPNFTINCNNIKTSNSQLYTKRWLYKKKVNFRLPSHTHKPCLHASDPVRKKWKGKKKKNISQDCLHNYFMEVQFTWLVAYYPTDFYQRVGLLLIRLALVEGRLRS